MNEGQFMIRFRSEEIDEESLHDLLRALEKKKITAEFITESGGDHKPSLVEPPDGTYANANEEQRNEFLAALRRAIACIPYLEVVSATSDGEVPYMIQLTAQVAKIGDMVDAVRADISKVLETYVICGRKTARLVRETPDGFEVLLAIMDDSKFFVTARLGVILGDQKTG